MVKKEEAMPLRYHTRLKILGFCFILPAIFFLALFVGYPLVMSFFLGFTDYQLGIQGRFVGLTNYLRILQSSGFQGSLRVTFTYVFGTVVPVWFSSFGVAMLLARLKKGLGFWRTALFFPTVMPIVSVAMVWKFLFHYQGLVNSALSYIGMGPLPWLTSSRYAPLALIITSWWHAVSYYMVLFLAGILAIPSVYQEAAQIDGAGPFQRLLYITLPLMRPTIVLVLVTSIINGFRTFALQKIMTNGGPGVATEITTLHIYKTAFNFGRYGEAAAMSVVYFLIILAFSLVQLRVLQGGEENA